MTAATGLFVVFSRCNDAKRIPDWNRWMRDEHVPAMAQTEGVRAATHWALSVQPTPGMPSVGFSHVSLYELSDAVPRAASEAVGDAAPHAAADAVADAELRATADALVARESALREAGALDPNHCVIETDLLAAHGRWQEKPLPSPALVGHVFAYVGCNDPRVEAEWDAWNDDVHMPDMLASDAFEGVTRWRRLDPGGRRAKWLTLYEVGSIGIDEAVARSAAAMPGIVAAGRKHAAHVGGLTVTLVRA